MTLTEAECIHEAHIKGKLPKINCILNLSNQMRLMVLYYVWSVLKFKKDIL